MKCLLCLSLLLTAGWMGSCSEPATARPLSLDECIQLALKQNYDLQIERLNPEIARYNLSGADGAYEPVFNFSAGQQLLTVPGGVDPKKTGLDSPYELTTDSVGMGISGLLPTGLQYGIQANANRLKEVTDFSAQPGFILLFPPNGIRNTNQYTASAAITLDQPLLRNLWIDQYRQSISVSRKNLQISEMALRWRVMNLVNNIQQAYYELIFARENERVQAQALQLAETLAEITRRRVQVGSLSTLDTQQAAARVESVRTALFAARQNLAKHQNNLKNLISNDFKTWADAPVEPAEGLVPVPDAFDRAERWRTAFEHRPDLAQLRLDLEKQGIMTRYRFNQIFPSLDLVGGFGLESQENTGEAALADIRDRTKPQYGFGVVLSIPLAGNRAARGSYKASQAAKQQTILQLKKLEQNVLVQVDDALTLAQSAYQRTESARLARQYAETALQGEQRRLEDGTSSAFVVLEYQQKLTEAHTSEIRALADYSEALAQLDLNEGSTLEKNHINLQVK
ncbi:MAG TPA: TolC family protein [Candidatus Limnocylindria bacterium]|nr:TolC family protein [Candidatus Limnocylindria bacterium]